MIEGAFAAALDSLPSLSAAAESHIYDALTQHLGRYIHLSRDQLSVSAWEGDCVVEGIAVRTRLRPGDILRRINGVAIDNTGDVAKVAAIRSNGYEIGFERNGQRALIRLRNR